MGSKVGIEQRSLGERVERVLQPPHRDVGGRPHEAHLGCERSGLTELEGSLSEVPASMMGNLPCRAPRFRHSGVVTALGRQEGEILVVDLGSSSIDSWSELWDALLIPCGLPNWFGRNLNAWWDTIQTGAISEVIDDHRFLVVRVSPEGLFAPGAEGERFIQITNECEYAIAEFVSADARYELP